MGMKILTIKEANDLCEETPKMAARDFDGDKGSQRRARGKACLAIDTFQWFVRILYVNGFAIIKND